VQLRVTCNGIRCDGSHPDLRIVVRGSGLHAPLVDRLLELPFDISGGRLDGELRLRSHDAETWHLPSFGGRVR
jgi:hypothetical protein